MVVLGIHGSKYCAARYQGLRHTNWATVSWGVAVACATATATPFAPADRRSLRHLSPAADGGRVHERVG